MNKNNKILSILSLSALAFVTLASCGGNGGGTDRPAFHVYAVSTDSELSDEECITASLAIDGKIEYNKDLKITIKPNMYFSLKNNDGSLITPYVGLGTPTAKFEAPLIKDVAWTYDDKSSADSEEYLLTVKGEYFKKNVIISYGDAGETTVITDKVRCEQNDYYFYSNPKEREYPIEPKSLTDFGTIAGYPDQPIVTDIFNFNLGESISNFAREYLTFTFETKNEKDDPSILDLEAYQAKKIYQPTTNPTPVDKEELKYIDVIGVMNQQPSAQDIQLDIIDPLDSKPVYISIKDNKLYVNIPWEKVIAKGEGMHGYTHKFHHIDFKFDPVYMGHPGIDKPDQQFGVKTTVGTNSGIVDYRAGYLSEDIVSTKFKFFTQTVTYENQKVWGHSQFKQSGTLRFDYANTEGTSVDNTLFGTTRLTEDKENGGHISQLAGYRQNAGSDERTALKEYIHPGFDLSAVDHEVLSGKYKYDTSLYSANFIWNRGASGPEWPVINITTTDATGGSPKKLDWTNTMTTDWRNKEYWATSGQSTEEELDYIETKDGNWRLVNLNKRNRKMGISAFDERYLEVEEPGAYDLRGKDNAYVLYSLKGDQPFKGVASINIDIVPNLA